MLLLADLPWHRIRVMFWQFRHRQSGWRAHLNPLSHIAELHWLIAASVALYFV